ncbi:uncharacterized protein LOC8284443 [Ricinus communis]|uniref:uncharacterized protein LOC8284443 n=1 Tax=Ricinus communis TaxID=3988 RepID=UPI000772C62E|nr:uncharacterized protein LOC8284443 [Ricinus communis]XP_015571997.1 uncharacterized protein LOC8284443 [Ricinus communis]XP_048228924.1 uncharacterized protein LOC8284443 [Ricinus communis]XP_048228925.1 uncharacterized protein LOC8284443 [Ricinus communis]XP_048228926.1 uncharacterized protein LOC8284443 [Ricinus communis]|eukprot:XP_015571995.1 uncharacterized protein LOC8284443 [Ricinus communis]
MPGNEVGDRIHNFFGQESLSQGQHRPEVVEGTWPGLGNNQWVGSQRQIGTPFISNLKNHSIQQSADTERGNGGQSSGVQHGASFSQSTLRPEFARSQAQNPQPTLNGYLHGNQVFQTRQNEANFLGVDSESDRRNLTSRGFSVVEAQLGSDELQKKSSARMDFNESPVNYDFLGGQQQLNSQHPGMFQSLQRQQSGISDMQLLQQQVMLKQMQEIQRQHQQHQQQQQQKQQLQQQEARQVNSVNQVSSFAKQAAGSHPPALINGIPIHDASNYSWQLELVAANTNWPQRNVASAMQGSSSGLMFSPEQGQGPRLMGMIPQQVDQSLYGVPISGTRVASNQYSPVQMDKSTLQHISGSSSSFSGNQYTGFQDQASMQDSTLVSRQGYQGKNVIGTADSQGLNGGFNLESLQQVDLRQSNGSGQDFHGGQDAVDPSETSQGRSVMQVTPSQNVATLDPTEEKILFGSDDNLWEAFGRGTNMGPGGCNMLDGTDLFGAFPSVQSGSWSALMQSAVAETSSAEMGLQEEWSGLASRGSEPSAGNQLAPNIGDSRKKQPAWADNRLQAGSTGNASPYNMSDGISTSINHNNMPGVKQSGDSISYEQNQMLHTSSSQRFVQPFTGQGAKWLDRKLLQKPVSEGSNNNEKGAHSSNAELNAKFPGPCTNQQSMASYNTGGQPSRPNGWKSIDPVSPGPGAVLKNQGSENSLQASQSTEHKSPMFEAMGYRADIWKNESVSNSFVELEQAKSTTGSPQVNREDSDHNNIAALPDSSTVRAKQESSQQLPNGNNFDVWKHVDSSVNSRGRGFPGRYQSRMDKSPQTFESSGNIVSGDGAVKSHDHPDMKESKIDSSRNAPHYTSTSAGGENAWLDANDLSGGKLKSSSNIGRRPSGVRKFQYHPMGDLGVDVESSYGTKHATLSQSLATQVSQGSKVHDHGDIGKSKFPAQIARNSMEIDKGRFPGFQGETKGSDEMILKNRLSGSAPSTSTSFDRAVYSYATSKTTPSSQNMLELLHKVDQSREHGNAAHFSSSDCNQPSQMHEAKNSAGSVYHQQHQSSTSQGFGLRLAPPSQLLPIQDHAFSSQSPSQTINSLSSTHVASEVGGGMGHPWSASSIQVLPPGETSQGESRNNISGTNGQTGKNLQGNFAAGFSPGYPYSRSLVQNQQSYDIGGQATSSQSGNVLSDRFASQSIRMNESFERAKSGQSVPASVPNMSRSTSQNSVASSGEMPQLSNNNQNNAKDSSQQFPILESVSAPQGSTVSGTSLENASAKMSPAMWNGVSAQQRLFGSHPFKVSSNIFKSNLQPNNDSETTSPSSQKVEGYNIQMIGKDPSESGACSGDSHAAKGDQAQQNTPENDPAQTKMSISQGKESVSDPIVSSSVSDPNSTQREIEAFGRSLRPNNILHQNYTLMHQAQSVKNADIDPGNRSLKRFRGPDGPLDAQQVGNHEAQQFYAQSNMVRDASGHCASIPPRDSKMLSFSSKSTDVRDTSIPSKDALAFGQNDTQNLANSNAVPVRNQNSLISPQMAPSWFDQHGTFKNGQVLPFHDAQRPATMKAMELPFSSGRPSSSLHAQGPLEQRNAIAANACQHALVHKSSTSSIASEDISSPQLMSPDAVNMRLAALRPKKRKTATSELVPWHKQVLSDLPMLQNISSAELDWAQAANRLTEKVEDEAEMLEDGPPVFRSKRRLLLTTQLMQLLFRPPSASVLSADAIPHYESVVHFLARATLGDTCSTLACAGSDNSMSSSGSLVPVKTFERISDQYFSKVVEDLISRARKLENDLLRLDKRASVLDLRVECQELEKYSVINRFAKFHGRGQGDGSETSLSDATAQKSCLQRYVTALPMPRNLPDRVQCFSL